MAEGVLQAPGRLSGTLHSEGPVGTAAGTLGAAVRESLRQSRQPQCVPGSGLPPSTPQRWGDRPGLGDAKGLGEDAGSSHLIPPPRRASVQRAAGTDLPISSGHVYMNILNFNHLLVETEVFPARQREGGAAGFLGGGGSASQGPATATALPLAARSLQGAARWPVTPLRPHPQVQPSPNPLLGEGRVTGN